MELFNHILLGFQIMLDPIMLLFCFIGVFVGTLIGVLPGIGPAGTIALLLPITTRISPTAGLVMLAGIYYGAMYGGSTTSILVNIPGEAASVITCLDGYQMARQGRAGPALGIAAWGSFIAGTISVFGLAFVAAPLAKVALSFGPPEYFALMCSGLLLVTYLAQLSVMKGIMMALLGILIGSVGLDMITAYPRFTFGIDGLIDGVGIIPLVIGLFGISEILCNLEEIDAVRDIFKTDIRSLWPSLKDWADAKWSILRGTVLGFFIGLLPGGGGVLASFLSYAVEKRVSKHPEKFGKGAIEGVAAPESANNAAAEAALIPLLSLGIPSNVAMALFFAALMMQGISPGPLLIKDNPEIFWGLVASLYLGNIMLLILNLPLIGLWVKVLKVPYQILFPLILLFCVIGTYSVNGSSFDLIVMTLFGAIGYLMRKFGFEGAPLVLACVLGPKMEGALRQSLLMSQGSFSIFVTRPICTVTLVVTFLIMLSGVVAPIFKRHRQEYTGF